MRVILPIVLILFSGLASAADYFSDCDAVLDGKQYLPLSRYITKNNLTPDLCQRLNDKEYIYTTTDSAGHSWFFYCDATNSGDLKCEADNENTYYPNLTIVKRFFGKSGKQFVLFETSLLRGGGYGTGFTIFHLVPKSDSPRGYALYRLENVGAANGTYSDSGEICSYMGKQDAVMSGNPLYEIGLSKGRDSITFNQTINSCDGNNVIASQAVTFVYVGNRFRLQSDLRSYK